MCRNIKVLANFEPPATTDEVRASALQFVRKLSGTTKPSKANEAVFNQAVDDVTAIARRLIESLVIHSPPRNREVEAKKGQRISAEIEAMRLGATLFDPYIAILDAKRFELAISDDAALLGQVMEALGCVLNDLSEPSGSPPEEVVVHGLTRVRALLEEISGARTQEDVLAHIFARFCIGK